MNAYVATRVRPARRGRVGSALVGVVLLAACGNGESTGLGAKPGSRPQREAATSAPVSSSVPPSVVELPWVDYYKLTALMRGATFDVSAAPCFYLNFRGESFAAVFPPGSTFDVASAQLSIPGDEPILISDALLDVGGGGMSMSNVRNQDLRFDSLGCEIPERFYSVASVRSHSASESTP